MNKAGSLPTAWLQEQEIFNAKGSTETLQKNIDALKKIQSDVRSALHFPSEEQMNSDKLTYTEEDQKTGLKVELDELNAQIAYELGRVKIFILSKSQKFRKKTKKPPLTRIPVLFTAKVDRSQCFICYYARCFGQEQ